MRKLACCLGVLLLPLAGCASLINVVGPGTEDRRPASNQPPTPEQLVSYQKANADLIKSMQVRYLDMECKQGKIGASVGGSLHCQKPRDFRLMAGSIAGEEVDLGSNGEEFWFWVKRGDPRVFHCAYADFEKGEVRLPFPFQPEYVLEALGMSAAGHPENCEVVPHKETWELVEKSTAQGKPVRKITVFRKAPLTADDMRKGKPQVLAYVLQDADGKHTIATAAVETVQLVDVGGVSAVVPKSLRLEYPDQQVTLRMKLDGVTLNKPFTAEQTSNLFTRSKLTHLRSLDLARLSEARPTGQIRRVAAEVPGGR
jgi:hypothetical protein